MANNPDKQPADELGRLYDRAARESSPAALDERILAEARRAVAKPRAGNPFQGGWKVPLSMAAVLVIGLAVILDVQRQQETGLPIEKPAAPSQSERAFSTQTEQSLEAREDTTTGFANEIKKRDAARASQPVETEQEGARLQQPAPAISVETERSLEAGEDTSTGFAPKVERQPTEPAVQPIQTEPAAGARLQESAPAADAATPEQDFAPAPPQRQRATLQEQGEPTDHMSDAPLSGEAAEMEQSREESRSKPAPAAVLAPSSAASGQAASVLPAEEWIADIKKLIEHGDMVAARAQLAAFRRAYPDYPLDEELQGLLSR